MSLFRSLTVFLSFLCLPAFVGGATAGVFDPAEDAVPSLVVRTEANCYAVGQKLAAEKGGTLMQASAQTRGGQTVCHIVIRVPGSNGKRPRRAEFTVPAN